MGVSKGQFERFVWGPEFWKQKSVALAEEWDESLHPRDDDGKFADSGGSSSRDTTTALAKSPRVFNTPDEVMQTSDWGESRWHWKNEKGESSGRLLTGEPVPREKLPEYLLHVTTNASSVMGDGVLLGQRKDGGLGGGQADGVSFTTSEIDAHVIQRELDRAVRIARGDVHITDLQRFATEDEREAGLEPGALSKAVTFGKEMWDGNSFTLDKTFVWDKSKPEGQQGGWVGPRPDPEKREELRRSLMKDSFNSYLQIRGHFDKTHEILKNPILFGDQEKLAKIDPDNIRILKVPSRNIPATALVTTGSDAFLHEIRAYSDVPVKGTKIRRGKPTQIAASEVSFTWSEPGRGGLIERFVNAG